MDKKQFYKEQADKFRDYSSKFPDRDLLSIFEEWAESKDIYGKDKHEIWRIVRKMQPFKTMTIGETSEEFVRISAVLDIILQNDLARLNKFIERKEKEKNKLDKT